MHVPGEIQDPVETNTSVKFKISTWMEGPYFVLTTGLKQKPQLKIAAEKANCCAPHEFLEKEGQLILKLAGSTQIELGL